MRRSSIRASVQCLAIDIFTDRRTAVDLFETVYNYFEFGNGRVRRQRDVGLAEKTQHRYVAYGQVVQEKIYPLACCIIARRYGGRNVWPTNEPIHLFRHAALV